MFNVENHGSIVLIRPQDDTTREWLKENVQDDAQWYGNALVVEPRYVEGLVFGMIEAGLEMAS